LADIRVVYTDAALNDLDEILEYISLNYPALVVSFEKRLSRVVARIGDFPKSSEQMMGRPGVRVAPLNRYPYKVFYRIAQDSVEILYIHHAARDELDEGS